MKRTKPNQTIYPGFFKLNLLANHIHDIYGFSDLFYEVTTESHALRIPHPLAFTILTNLAIEL